jgi:hypothetical protein
MSAKPPKWIDLGAPGPLNVDRPNTLANFVGEDLATRLEGLLNDALDDTFPASDPVSSLRSD